MNVALRGFTILVGGTAAAVAIALSMQALPHPAGAASASVRIVNTCSQTPAVGHYTCFAERRSDLGFTSKAKVQSTPLATPSGYGPSNLQSAYNLPSSSAGAGQTVYIVDAFNDPNAESDLAVYRSQYGLPACTTANGCFKKLNQNGATSPLPSNDSGWAGEISLDLDMVSAICPNCKITLIEASDASNNLFIAVKEAVTLGAKFVSMSWGGNEDGSESSLDTTYFQASGVVYTASTGDGAYSAGVIYPATSPRVVGVGGTSLTTASNSRGWNETVWRTNSTEGTGSGCSSDEAKPAWQSIIATSVCSRRADSDVSAVADPATGVAVYQTFGGSGWAVYGGTSASAPIVASVYALAGTPGSSDHPAQYPYNHTSNLWDVTSGNNGSCSPSLLCTAAAGWDGPTGLGTPNGTAAFTPGSGGGGGGGGNTVTVTNPGSQTGTVGAAKSLQMEGTDSAGSSLTWSATGLPTGLSINSSTGLISGTPSAAGSFTSKVTAQDSTGASGNTTFNWTISSGQSGGCSSPGQKLRNRGFESGRTAWSANSGVIGQWGSSGERPRSGTWDAWLDGYGTTHTDTVSQSVTIPTGCSATLSFYLHIDTSERTTTTAYDKLTVKLGSTTLASYSNLNHVSGYSHKSFNVSSFAGRTVTLKFTGTEDASLQTSFVLDDTSVTVS